MEPGMAGVAQKEAPGKMVLGFRVTKPAEEYFKLACGIFGHSETLEGRTYKQITGYFTVEWQIWDKSTSARVHENPREQVPVTCSIFV